MAKADEKAAAEKEAADKAAAEKAAAEKEAADKAAAEKAAAEKEAADKAAAEKAAADPQPDDEALAWLTAWLRNNVLNGTITLDEAKERMAAHLAKQAEA
jgi:hypothetical protein